MFMHPSGSLALCNTGPLVFTHSGAILELGLYEDADSSPRGCWYLPDHDGSADQGMGFLMGR